MQRIGSERLTGTGSWPFRPVNNFLFGPSSIQSLRSSGRDELFPSDCGRDEQNKGKLCFGDPELCRISKFFSVAILTSLLHDLGPADWCSVYCRLQHICQICRPETSHWIDNNRLKQSSSLNLKWAMWRRILEPDSLLHTAVQGNRCCKSAGEACSCVYPASNSIITDQYIGIIGTGSHFEINELNSCNFSWDLLSESGLRKAVEWI